MESYPLKSGLKFRDNIKIDNREVSCIRCGASFTLAYDIVSSNPPIVKLLWLQIL